MKKIILAALCLSFSFIGQQPKIYALSEQAADLTKSYFATQRFMHLVSSADDASYGMEMQRARKSVLENAKNDKLGQIKNLKSVLSDSDKKELKDVREQLRQDLIGLYTNFEKLKCDKTAKNEDIIVVEKALAMKNQEVINHNELLSDLGLISSWKWKALVATGVLLVATAAVVADILLSEGWENSYTKKAIDGASAYTKKAVDGASAYTKKAVDGASAYTKKAIDGASDGLSKGAIWCRNRSVALYDKVAGLFREKKEEYYVEPTIVKVQEKLSFFNPKRWFGIQNRNNLRDMNYLRENNAHVLFCNETGAQIILQRANEVEPGAPFTKIVATPYVPTESQAAIMHAKPFKANLFEFAQEFKKMQEAAAAQVVEQK